MKAEVRLLLDKAEENLRGAELLARANLLGLAASRAYYAMFYAAEAVLLEDGQSFSRHGQVHAEFGKSFAMAGRLDAKLHRYLLDAFDTRQVADYSIEQQISAATASKRIDQAREFVGAVEAYLEKTV